jgi:Tol biopolymer transport system component
MRPNRIQYLSAAVLVAIGLAGASVAASASSPGEASNSPPPVEQVAQALAGPGVRSVIVFVSDRGKEHAATAGTSRPSADQRFRIGSVTKTFTATIVLQLVEEGKLRLESTLEDHVPGVVPRGDEITVRQLLAHRSGLANVTAFPAWMKQAERSSSTRPLGTLRFAGSHPLEFDPGSEYRYSNTNYIALGLVIEKASGHTYAQELERRILKPLGLDRTELPKTWRLPDHDDAGYNPNLPWAAGAIVSNAQDISRFYAALLSGRVLSRASLATMKGPPVAAGGGVATGLGIFPFPSPCGRTWGHQGFIVDYATSVSASAKGDRVAVVSVRGQSRPPDMIALLCGKSAAPRYVEPATVRAPSWSPDGRRIVFLSRRDGDKELYIVNADGSGQRRLTRDAMYLTIPAWSPDGRKIVFEGRPCCGVYVVNADGSGQRRLARNGHAPAWSPDGRRIAFFSDNKIYLMNADGSEHRALTRRQAEPRDLVWSPDGRKFAFLQKRGCGPGCYDIYVVNSDGSGLRNLTAKLASLGPVFGPHDPAWSPDGKKIAFVRLNASLGDPIYVVNADGGGLRNLTPKPVGASAAPAWSPDGRKLTFVSYRNGNSEVYVMNANGSGQRSLTRNPAFDGDPAWSPDGRKIAFVSHRDDSYGVYVMNADGSGQRKLAQRSP